MKKSRFMEEQIVNMVRESQAHGGEINAKRLRRAQAEDHMPPRKAA